MIRKDDARQVTYQVPSTPQQTTAKPARIFAVFDNAVVSLHLDRLNQLLLQSSYRHWTIVDLRKTKPRIIAVQLLDPVDLFSSLGPQKMLREVGVTQKFGKLAVSAGQLEIN